jgi:hypothetical protein
LHANRISNSCNTGARRRAIDKHGAGATLAFAAAVLASGQAKPLWAKQLKMRMTGKDIRIKIN